MQSHIMTHEEEIAVIDNIAYRLRIVAREYGEVYLEGAILIVPFYTEREMICGFPFVTAPTLCSISLGNVNWKVARLFEDMSNVEPEYEWEQQEWT